MRLNKITKALSALAILVLLLAAAPINPSTAQTAEDPQFVQAVNNARAQNGLHTLVTHSGLESWACQQSQRMASAGSLSHSDMSGARSQVAGATTAGENVAYGNSVSQIMGMWIGSSGHYANIHNPAFTHIGSCTVYSGGWLWVTNVFAGVPGGAAPQPSPPKSTTPKGSTCFGLQVTIYAQPGKTTIGTPGPDVILGTAGPDRIEGKGGKDRICSKGGNDTVLGGGGADWIHLGRGNDSGSGGPGNDSIKGAEGIDTIYGNGGPNDRCYGGSGYGDYASGSCEKKYGIP